HRHTQNSYHLVLSLNHTPPTAIYTLSLHDALPISPPGARVLIYKQDPSVAEIGIRKVFVSGRFLAGPRDARILNGTPGIPPVKIDRKSTRLNSSHEWISYAVFCLKKKIPRLDTLSC